MKGSRSRAATYNRDFSYAFLIISIFFQLANNSVLIARTRLRFDLADSKPPNV